MSLRGVCGKKALRQVPPPPQIFRFTPSPSLPPVLVLVTEPSSAVDIVYIKRIESGGGYQKSEEQISSIVRVEVSHLQVIDNNIHKTPLLSMLGSG